MSKLFLRVNYKDACILKHALRNQIESKKYYLLKNADRILKELCNKVEKELEEEERTLSRFTEEINKKKSSW